ncbi:MAG TPA: UDP-glucose/GDP-mannose dehydrogenase family protein [bacterium]|nr:UDP-glucose/GDP-mannose dehydrogenase family protein [bacterium]
MNIAVVGTGYVGLVTGSCFADLGNQVTCVDVDARKVRELRRGVVPIFEPGLEDIVRRNKGSRLSFTTDLAGAVRDSDFIFIAVNTPPNRRGEADISNVEAVARGIARSINGYKIIINKSTVPIGMGDIVGRILRRFGPKGAAFDVVSNPEFLREGSAVTDLLKPERVVIGASRKEAAHQVAEIYKPLKCPILITDLKSAEMIKYASNAFLAAKISFVNEIANLCDQVGADILQVTQGMSYDGRIGGQFLNAGLGFGGSCFPKDVSALVQIGKHNRYSFRMLPKVLEVNQYQRRYFLKKVAKAAGPVRGKTFAVWGLSFKPNTDDLREAPSLTVVPALLAQGARVRVYDPVAMPKARGLFPKARFCKDAYEAARGADAVLVLTDWNEFKQVDLGKLRSLVKRPILLDGRNMYDAREMAEKGFAYQGMGRGAAAEA